ncbi:NAD(P)-dependent oxidoreductase [Streptomyces sp. cg28]|uniref:NAD(P)-dependent oxidoreductase n=1 Tax=Streptomyces sp. cg28 TaxID=3403457 RepID=UPI003B21DDFA
MVQQPPAAENGDPIARQAGSVSTVEISLTDDDPTQILDAVLRRVLTALHPAGPRVTAAGPQTARIDLEGGACLQLTVGEAAPAAAHSPGTHLLVLSVLRRGQLSAAQEANLTEALRQVPFTAAELREVAQQMPLTLGLAERITDAPLAGSVLLIMAHYLEDLSGMLDGATRLGARAETLVVVEKGYPYRSRDRVVAHLRDRGIVSFHSSRITDALAHQSAVARRLGLKPVIIDDGGYALPALIESMPEQLAACAGLVEQTMSGIFKLEPYADRLALPIFSVAQSHIKGTIESYWIADAAVRRILDLMPPHKVEGQPALVIGYGQVGSEIARVLQGLRMRVAVFDRELMRLVVAHEAGYVTHNDLTRLIEHHRPLLIVGATGRQALTEDDLSALPAETFLASVTSRDGEFPLSLLSEMAHTVLDEGTTGTTYVLGHGTSVTVLANGFPVNFHYAESVRNRHSDLTLASLLVGACTLARDGHGFSNGHNVERTDEVLHDSRLLADYYDRYGPSLPAPLTAKDTP